MRITDMSSGQALNIGNISDILGKLNAGDVLRAQVLDFAANELLLKLFDGTTVKASSMTPIDVKKGEFVDFKVRNKTESQLFIETLKNGVDEKSPKNDIALKLSAIGIKADQKNIEIANALKSYDLPLNKEIFTKVTDYIKAFKNSSPQKAAFLTSNSMGVNQKNIDVLSNIVDGRMRIGQNISDLLDSLERMDDTEALERLEKGLAGINAARGGRDVKNSGSTKGAAVSIADVTEEGIDTGPGVFDTKSGGNETKALQDYLGRNLPSAGKPGLQDIIKLVERGAADNILDKGLAEKITARLKAAAQSPEGIILKDMEDIEALLKNTATGREEKNSGVKSGTGDTERAEKHERLGHLKKAVEDIFIKLDSRHLEKDLNMKSVYKDILEKLEVIKESLAGSNTPAGDSLANKMDNIQSGIRFLNEINSHSTYIQIPISIMDKKTSGELYILKRDSKRKKIDPENVTMYISLDTLNIGKIDSLISLTKKNISLNMRVGDKGVQEFIKESHSELYKRLDDIGYKLVDLKCRIISEDVNLLNINDVVEKETAASKASIDCKI